jgi:hypothetical protein
MQTITSHKWAILGYPFGRMEGIEECFLTQLTLGDDVVRPYPGQDYPLALFRSKEQAERVLAERQACGNLKGARVVPVEITVTEFTDEDAEKPDGRWTPTLECQEDRARANAAFEDEWKRSGLSLDEFCRRRTLASHEWLKEQLRLNAEKRKQEE